MNHALLPSPDAVSRGAHPSGQPWPRSAVKPAAIPPFVLLTNDHVECVHRELRLRGEALWYTHHGYRGLFGGIWRTGRTYFTPALGVYLGPEVFYPVGATDREAQAAFGRSRADMIAGEARIACSAHAFVEPAARELGGTAHLDLAGRESDRHTLHVFLPIAAVQERFTPREWFLFWRQENAKFHVAHEELHGRERLVGSCA